MLHKLSLNPYLLGVSLSSSKKAFPTVAARKPNSLGAEELASKMPLKEKEG